MAGQMGARPVQGFEFFIGKITHDCQRGIYAGAGVSLGADQLVPVFPLGILRVHVHDRTVEHSQCVSNTQRAAHMAEASGLERLQCGYPDLKRQLFQFQFFCIRQHSVSPSAASESVQVPQYSKYRLLYWFFLKNTMLFLHFTTGS